MKLSQRVRYEILVFLSSITLFLAAAPSQFALADVININDPSYNSGFSNFGFIALILIILFCILVAAVTITLLIIFFKKKSKEKPAETESQK